MKGVRSGVERRRGVSGLKPGCGRRETTAKVLKDRRPHRERGRMGTSVMKSHLTEVPRARVLLLLGDALRLRVRGGRGGGREESDDAGDGRAAVDAAEGGREGGREASGTDGRAGVSEEASRAGRRRGRRGRGLKARDPGRRESPAKVLKDRRSPRERGRMGTSLGGGANDRSINRSIRRLGKSFEGKGRPRPRRGEGRTRTRTPRGR